MRTLFLYVQQSFRRSLSSQSLIPPHSVDTDVDSKETMKQKPAVVIRHDLRDFVNYHSGLVSRVFPTSATGLSRRKSQVYTAAEDIAPSPENEV